MDNLMVLSGETSNAINMICSQAYRESSWWLKDKGVDCIPNMGTDASYEESHKKTTKYN